MRMTNERIIAMEQAGTAIQLCALANLQSALALPLLAARRASSLDVDRLMIGILEHIDGSIATFEQNRVDPRTVDSAAQALAHDTVEYSAAELRSMRDALTSARAKLGTTRAVRTFHRRISLRAEALVRTLPVDSPLRDTAWTPSLETTGALPSTQLVHYLALTPAGLMLRETLHQVNGTSGSA
jgi:hypothetical protein